MKRAWKTKNHYYITRFAFIGKGCQVSISNALYMYCGRRKYMTRENVKRKLIDEWKNLWIYWENPE